MTFGENQYFYASLMALASLPGGLEHAGHICQEFRKEMPDLTILASKEKGGDTADKAQYVSFFNALYSYLSNGGAPNDPVFDTSADGILTPGFSGAGRRYIELNRTGSWGDSPHQRCREQLPDSSDTFFSNPLEYAVNKTGMERDLVGNNINLTLQDDGQILAVLPSSPAGIKKRSLLSLPYPGRPEPKHKVINLSKEDFTGCPRAEQVDFFRIVALEPNQSLKWIYNTVANTTAEMPHKTKAGEVAYIVKNNLISGELEDVRDEDILHVKGPVKTNNFSDKKYFSPGYTDYCTRLIEETGTPGIIRQVSQPYFVIEVKEPVQFGAGCSAQFAEPGDKIILLDYAGNHSPRVLRKEWLNKGLTTLAACDVPEKKKNSGPQI